MNVTFKKLHPHIGAEVSPLDLRQVHDRPALDALVSGMDEHGVLVFRDQPFTDAEQLAFAERFGGPLHVKPGVKALGKNRFDNDAIADIGNINESGGIRAADDRRRAYSLANRMWHTDASFQDPAGRYSTLSAPTCRPLTTRSTPRPKNKSRVCTSTTRSLIRDSCWASNSRGKNWKA